MSYISKKTLTEEMSRAIVKFVLGNLKGFNLREVNESGVDVIVEDETNQMKYVVAVEGRNIPVTETASTRFEKEDLDNLKAYANNNNVIPLVSFVMVKNEIVDIYILKLTDIEILSADPEFKALLPRANNGLGINNSPKVQQFLQSDSRIDHTQLKFSLLKKGLWN